jgi:hypothetical protein
LDPIYKINVVTCVNEDDDTVVISNTARTNVRVCPQAAINVLTIAPNLAVADTGATSIFIMDGIDVDNKRLAKKPLTVNLPDGRRIKSTHVCDVNIPHLPTLTGHIIPELKIASLMGIRPLCKVGCKVIFDDKTCHVVYNEKVILRGYKDPATDLWTLPIPKAGMLTTPSQINLPRPCPSICRAPHSRTEQFDGISFLHSVRTRANNVKFVHQALCNPKISTLLRATRRGFLKGCPHISEKLITKYLNPSPATAKGHMKRPRHGIRSTTPKQTRMTQPSSTPQDTEISFQPPLHPEVEHSVHSDNSSTSDIHARNHDVGRGRHPLISEDEEESTIANVFAFGAFADKNDGIVYHDLTGSFPFMSLDGSVCFFVLYHYESNSILPTPISGLDDVTIFNAYKAQFEELVKKGYKPKLNVTDNQATKHIKKFLTENECKMQLVEPHNHRVNAAERAIQTFKDAFIAALATTDSEFPLQLWDRLTPQVSDTLNLMRASRINPAISAYEALYGPYDWNRYPLAPLGCKAVVYEDGESRGSWAARGIDGWYLGPSKDHYRCSLYYIPETRAYRISGSTELFPQHCQIPNLTPTQHFRALTDELADETAPMNATPKGRRLLRLLKHKIDAIENPPPVITTDEQIAEELRARMQEQRVIDETPILTIPRITNAPPIMKARNPTTKRMLKHTPRLHRRNTRNNKPGAVPAITRDITGDKSTRATTVGGTDVDTRVTRTSPRTRAAAPKSTFTPVPSVARHQMVTRQAINVLTTREQAEASDTFTPRRLIKHASTIGPTNFEHFASPMVHPITGKTISSYKKLMNDPATAEVWQTAFGKDFGGMAQGDNKTGQKGTNAMFVMTHLEVAQVLRDGKKFTFANPVVDYRPQKDDPNRIRITAMGNLVSYDGELSVRTADINTAKIHWNSVISNESAKYMCIDIKNFYLTAKLEYFEYMKIPFALFPNWIVEQYNLDTHQKDGWVHLEMRKAVWGLPQAGILANKRLRRKLAPFGYFECVETPGLWKHESRPLTFTLVVDDFGVKYERKEDVEHLIASLQTTYKLTEDWTGNLYCGISLDWDYTNRTVDISMPGYIKKKLQEYNHIMPGRIQTCPYSPDPKKFGTDAQSPIDVDTSQPLDTQGIKKVQKIVGSILYYARAVDMTVLMALSSIAVEQTRATTKTMGRCIQLLDYLASNSEAKIRYYASDMVMNIHSDASYLSETKARSRACGHFFMGWMPKHDEPIKINGAFYVNSTILKFVVASAAEAELGALFHNCQDGIIFRQTLTDMGHPQPKTPVHCDNATAVGIANNTVKRQRSRSMEMRFFWIGDKVAQEMYALSWHPGQENLADYQSKHHIGAHHIAVRPWYLHTATSPRELPRAARPSTLKGCVGTLQNGYVRNVPLPRVPRIQSVSLVTGDSGTDPSTCYSQVLRVPMWSNRSRSLQGLGKKQLLPLFPRWLM